MSKMKLDRKPPLAKSPVRLRPNRSLRSSSISLQTPQGSLTKSKKPRSPWEIEKSELRPDYRSISCEIRALSKIIRDEIGNVESNNAVFTNTRTANSSPLFKRGRFYDEYSARRNERLKRKKGGETGDEGNSVYKLGVNVESVKRRDSKKFESLRKSVSAAYSVERGEAAAAPRYMLRSMSKENRKPPLAVNSDRSVVARRVAKI